MDVPLEKGGSLGAGGADGCGAGGWSWRGRDWRGVGLWGEGLPDEEQEAKEGGKVGEGVKLVFGVG